LHRTSPSLGHLLVVLSLLLSRHNYTSSTKTFLIPSSSSAAVSAPLPT
jgi:hypothetical protein